MCVYGRKSDRTNECQSCMNAKNMVHKINMRPKLRSVAPLEMSAFITPPSVVAKALSSE